MKKHSILVCLLVIGIRLFGQEANIDKGCVPLLVDFTSTLLSEYYWDFGDNANSNLQNPGHNYTTAGNYTVTLSEGPNGTQIGQIQITVFPELAVNITPDITAGCIPLPVNFTSSVQIPNGLLLDSIKWTLGDGAEINGLNISHVYNLANIFDVSLQLYTNIPTCNKVVVFEDVIEAEDLNTKITTEEAIPCSEPAATGFKIEAQEDPRYTYNWDFGNGQTADTYESGIVTYNNFGEYLVSLTIASPSGCNQTSYQRFRVGGPIPLVELPDTVCIGEIFTVTSNTNALRHDWMWGDTLTRVIGTEINCIYHTPGLKEIQFTTYLDPNCPTDTVYTVFVELPDASSYLTPQDFCSDEVQKSIVANNTDYVNYIWNDVETQSSTFELQSLMEPRDSLFINIPTNISINLQVESAAGCKAEMDTVFITRLPEAYFHCAPRLGVQNLDVTFKDYSSSKSNIIRRHWIYGNGDETTFTDDTREHEYYYDTCGIYFPKLVIEDSDGCIDTSKGVEIKIIGCDSTFIGIVIGQDTSSGVPNPTDLYNSKICVNDFYTFKVGSGFTQYHIGFDDDRLDHCWLQNGNLTHQFRFPGTFTPHIERYWETLLIDEFMWDEVTVCGARAVINFSKDCVDPFAVSLRSESLNATSQTWTYDGQIISTEANVDYRFDTPGIHTVELSAINDIDPCDADVTTVDIYVTIPRASFTMPDVVCDSVPVILDASNSHDVMGSCHHGYLWEFEHHRPRESGNNQLEHFFHKGLQEVSLTVTDINGCTAKTTESIQALGLDPDFNLDSLVCLPYPKEFQDLSQGDTTITSWAWNFGSQDQNPTYEFNEGDIDPETEDSIFVQLAIEDSFGCKDTMDRYATVFDPAFGMDINRGVFICQGDELRFFVVDTFMRSDLFNFNWKFGLSGMREGRVLDYVFEEAGEQEIRLSVEQKLGGCSVDLDTLITVFEAPVASFISDIDGEGEICYPAQIAFIADPQGPQFNYEWQFGTEDTSIIANPTIDFGRGTHQVQLIVSNERNCTDTVRRDFTLAGAEGSFIIDKSQLCLDDIALFTLVDTSGVGSFIWDFGDGTTVRDENPVSHQYSFKPPGESTFVSLFLESPDSGCNATDSIPIFINEVNASFSNLDSINICDGRTRLLNESIGANSYLWNFDNGTESNELNPTAFYDLSGSYTVSLLATDLDSGCESEYTEEINVPDRVDQDGLFPNIFSPNGDALNDRFGPIIPDGLESEVQIQTFRIYNRWGQLVYDNSDPRGWDGNFNLSQAETEVYGFYIELLIEGCDLITKKGNVTLVR